MSLVRRVLGSSSSGGGVAGASDWFDVSAYAGADPTGATNSDAAFSAARGAGFASGYGDGVPTVYFPAGNWKFASPLNFANISVKSAGYGSVKLQLASDLAAANVIATPAAPSGFTSASTGGSLAQSTQYAYRVAAFGDYGATGWSAEATFTTPASGTATNTVSFNVTVPEFTKGLLIYGRTAAGELLIARVYFVSANLSVSGNVWTFTDTGAVTPAGTALTANKSACGTSFFIDQQPSTAMATPPAVTLAGAAGGSLASATTYYFRAASCVQWGKTLASVEASASPGGSNGSIVITATPSEGAQSVEFFGRTQAGELLLGYRNVGSSYIASNATLPTATISVIDGRQFNPAGGQVVIWQGGTPQIVTYTGVTFGVTGQHDKLTGCSGGSGSVGSIGSDWIGQVVTFTDDGSVTPSGALPVSNTTGGVGVPAATHNLIGGAPKAETLWEDLWLANNGLGQRQSGVGADYWVPGTQTTACRIGNGATIRTPRIDGWFCGVYIFSDHEEIYDGAIGGNYYGVYYGQPSQSSGDQIIRRTRLDGSTWASFAMAQGKNWGGKAFYDIHAGNCPFGLYKELSDPAGDVVSTGKRWELSFESCFNANIFCGGEGVYRGASLGGTWMATSTNVMTGTHQAPIGTPDRFGRIVDRISYVVDLNGGACTAILDAPGGTGDIFDPGSFSGFVACTDANFSGENRNATSLATAASNTKPWTAGGNSGFGELRQGALRGRPMRSSPSNTILKGDLVAYSGLVFGGGAPGQAQVQRYDKAVNNGGSMRPAGVAAHGGMSVDGSTVIVYVAGGPVSIRQSTAVTGGMLVAPDPANAGCVQPLAGVQILTSQGAPTGGTFTLTFRGQTTGTIAFNASAATIQTALQALTTIGAGNVICVGGAVGTKVIWIMFAAALALGYEQPPITSNSAGLTGGTTPTVDVAAGDSLIVGESLQSSSGGLVQVNLR